MPKVTKKTKLVGPRKNSWKKQSWDESYQQLVAYQRKHGSCDVPHSEYPKLAGWVSVQKGRNRSKLRQDQIDRLNSIGFNWDKPDARFEKKWNEKFELLKAYKREHGTAIVPELKDSIDNSLSYWVKRQRSKYHRKKLRRDRQEKLDEIGFVWESQRPWSHDRDVSRLEDQWQDNVRQTRAV